MIERPPTQRSVSSQEMQVNPRDFLSRAGRHEEHLVVEENGVPLAAVISVEDYEQYRRLLTAAEHTRLARAVGAEAERQGLTEEELYRELRETRHQVFQERYGNRPR